MSTSVLAIFLILLMFSATALSVQSAREEVAQRGVVLAPDEERAEAGRLLLEEGIEGLQGVLEAAGVPPLTHPVVYLTCCSSGLSPAYSALTLREQFDTGKVAIAQKPSQLI